MKKLLTLSLAILMLMTLMSCTQKPKTAYEIITEAQEKTAKLDSFSTDIDLDMTLGFQGISFSAPTSISINATGIQSDSPKASIAAEMSYMGMGISFDFYYEGEYLYLSAMGTNVKFNTKALTETLPNEDMSAETEELQKEYDQLLIEALADAEVQENEDGSKTISYKISSEKMTPFINKLLAEDANEGEENSEAAAPEINLSDVEMTQTMDKNGYVSGLDFKFSVSVTEDLGEEGAIIGMDKMEITFEIEGTGTINEPGEPVEVTPMEGYESFEEVTPDEDMLEDFVPVM